MALKMRVHAAADGSTKMPAIRAVERKLMRRAGTIRREAA
jgi:hypothetical protein